jgi:rod shape-determining protein MreC
VRAPRGNSVTRVAMPVRALVQRFAYVLLIAAAFALMLLGKAETVVVERLRAAAVDVAAPIMGALSRPAATVAGAVEKVEDMFSLYGENTELRAQNQRLLEWQQTARHLAEENKRLKLLLDYVPQPGVHSVTARVVADAGGVFVRSVIVAAGSRDGVRKGSAVIAPGGLVGRIASVGHRSARVLFITDLNSRLPVLIQSNRTRAILAGDNSPQPKAVFLPPGAEVSIGDSVVTSGHGGMFPPGLRIGEVVGISERGVRVQPFVRFDRLEYVRILDYVGPPRPDAPATEPAP